MVIVYDSDTTKKSTESELEYVQRMCSTKEINKLTWKGLTELLNETLGYSFSESYYRKHFSSGDFAKTVESETTSNSTAESTYTYCTDSDCGGECSKCDDLPVCLESWKEELLSTEEKVDEKMLKMRKERTKLNDERAANNRLINRLAREETIIEIARDYAKEMTSKKKLPFPAVTQQCMIDMNEDEGLLLLSDWHYGMVCDNPWNKFSPDVCRVRVAKLLERVINIVKEKHLHKVTVMNLSDLIAGRIHTQIRIESRFDVITQTMEVAEILAEFITNLSLHCKVSYYDCLDNHSRLEPNKNDSIDLESLVRIIPWYLKERLCNNENVHIYENEFGADIITCKILGHDVIGVHGDQDSPVTGIDKLTLMTHRHYDLFCTAHRHHITMNETNGTIIVGNGSLMGADSYALKCRLTSVPSQTFIVVSKSNVIESVHRIVLE